MSVFVRNPHTVMAALKRRPKEVLRIEISPNLRSDAWQEVIDLARKKGIAVSVSDRGGSRAGKNEHRTADVGGREGASHAVLKELTGVSLQELFAPYDPKNHGLWLALDSLQDPQNVGAIFRAAAFFGIRGIVVTEERSAPLSETVYDVSSGGIECVPFSLVTNLKHALEEAKEKGLWVLGTSEHADEKLGAVDRDRSWLMVLGNEEKGLRRLTLESCDMTCSIPAFGEIGSLNVSVASGILMATLTGATTVKKTP